MALLHRLHSAVEESWPRWVWASLNGAPLDAVGGDGALCGSHWSSLLRLLPLCRSISRVAVGDDARTSFWMDSWLPVGPLMSAMAELYSHCTSPSATVQQVIRAGLDSLLVRRLSSSASKQRGTLLDLLRGVHLDSTPDRRSLPLCGKKDGGIRTSDVYGLCTMGGVQDEHYALVWRNWAPSGVRFFAWLLVRGRIQCRANLLHKGIIDLAASGCPLCNGAEETPAHIMFGCPFARRFWCSIGAACDEAWPVEAAATCALPASAPRATSSTLRLLCFWHLWKHRNGVVFQGLPPSLSLLRKSCRDDATLWRARLPAELRGDVDQWLTYFLPERP
ncbi:uncharacterized protein [Lolium perenne]|uniref:uncharacterized protein n=1 Tax=Lolium perenne TaxID=4522 RepID=UPI0021F55D22|nr:uncharacterized protein LOC127340031 [Lolium perenne]